MRKPKEKKRLKSEDAGEAALAAVEKRARVASWAGGPNGGEGRQGAAGLLSVHPADALPVKLADGRLVYRRAATDADEGAPSVRGASKESRFKGRGRPEGGEEEGRGPAGVPKEEDEGGEEEEEEGEEGVSEDEKASLKKEAGARREVRKTEKPRGIDVQVVRHSGALPRLPSSRLTHIELPLQDNRDFQCGLYTCLLSGWAPAVADRFSCGVSQVCMLLV